MRIAYISGAYIPSRGANSMHVMRMCQAIARLGHAVTLHVRPGDCEADDDFEFYGVDSSFRLVKTRRPQIRAWGALVNAWGTRRAIINGPRPDVIYAREFWTLLLLSRAGVPFIFESHWRPKSRFHKAVEAAIMRSPSFRRVVLISDELRKIYAAEFPWLPPGKVVVAHDGADPEQPLTAVVPRVGRDGALQVGYIGSFQRGAGLDHLVEIARFMPEADFHVFGGSDEEVLGFSQTVSSMPNLLLHGFVRPQNLQEAYAVVDVVLSPYQASTASIGWCSPMKLFEYMSHGKAIVCSDFPVMREIINDGKDGLLVPSDDVLAWVHAIRGLNDRAERESLGRAARARLQREFTWNTRARRVLDGVA